MFFICITTVLVVLLTFYILEKIIRSLKVGGITRKCVFITGCDSGFGQKLAIRLDSLGFPVFAACLTDKGQTYLRDNASSRLISLSLNVTQKDSIEKAAAFVKEKIPQGSGLWAIVNNAGIAGPPLPTEMCDLDGFYQTCDVNLFGPIEVCRRFLPMLRKTKGRVVNISSVMGRNACALVAYNVSKFGMEGFSDSLRREVYQQGIKVSILEPGYFLTDILDRQAFSNSVNKRYSEANDEVKTAYGDRFVDKFLHLIDDSRSNASTNLDLVINAYTHAIVSRFPKTRYVIGWDAHLIYIPLTYLPGGVADWILDTMKNRKLAAIN